MPFITQIPDRYVVVLKDDGFEAASASFGYGGLAKVDAASFRIGDSAKLSESIAFAFGIGGDTFAHRLSKCSHAIWRNRGSRFRICEV